MMNAHIITIGDELLIGQVINTNDLLEFWEKDPGTKIVLLYLESFGNPRRFLEIARRVARTKPIVADGAACATSRRGITSRSIS